MRAQSQPGERRGPLRALLIADDPDPRLLQGGFTVLLGLAATLAIISGTQVGTNLLPLAGLILTGLAFVAALVVPWEKSSRALMGVLPVVDIAALGLARQNDTGTSTALVLIVVPALWLGWLFGRRGAAITVAAVLLLAITPTVINIGLTGEVLTRSLLVTVVTGFSALVIAVSREKAHSEMLRAAERGAELAKAVETIERQRRLGAAILETVDVGLVLLDENGRYQDTNRRHQDFMRLAFPDGHQGFAGQPGAVYGPDGVTQLTGPGLPTLRASNGEEFDDCRIWVGEDPLTRRALSVSARQVRREDGGFAGAALAYKDVTEFMHVLQVKDEFVASVSHELRTPLTSIMGYVDLLLDREDLPEEAARHLSVIDRNSARLLRLVADLLHTAQTDDGPMQVVRTRTDLSEIVRQSVGSAAPAAGRAGLTMTLDAPLELWLMVDAQRIAQVVDNLISNAIKYTPSGGRVEVALDVDADRAELTVTDSGIGIAPADRSRLFTRFFRTRDAEERSIQGVGLGLSIIKAIVDSHGGRIEVDSEAGVGSVFRVRLPIGVELLAEAPPADQPITTDGLTSDLTVAPGPDLVLGPDLDPASDQNTPLVRSIHSTSRQ